MRYEQTLDPRLGIDPSERVNADLTAAEVAAEVAEHADYLTGLIEGGECGHATHVTVNTVGPADDPDLYVVVLHDGTTDPQADTFRVIR